MQNAIVTNSTTVLNIEYTIVTNSTTVLNIEYTIARKCTIVMNVKICVTKFEIYLKYVNVTRYTI